ncbi:MAG: hypothetical protein AAF443_05760 [Chlamydiota bacterium]
MSSYKTPKKILVITSLCGGGHIQAAKAQAVKVLKENPMATIIEKDILIDWVGKRFGKTFVRIWNASQKHGNLTILNFLSKNVPTADIVLWPYIFLRSFFTLLKENVDQIIDTQPIGTPAIIKAIKCVQKINQKPLKLEKIVTELPTDHVIHFFKPIKKLSKENRSLVKLISTAPLLRQQQTADIFWQHFCGLRENEICYAKFPLRPSFDKYHRIASPLTRQTQIEIKVASYEEKHLIANTIKKGTLRTEIYRDKIAITIESTDKVATILLGSQPAEESTIKYVKNYIKMVQQATNLRLQKKRQELYPSHKTFFDLNRHLLFVFCNYHVEHKTTLLRRVHDFIQKIDAYPQNLTIIPMCFQGDEVIAPLYYRSDATFTRSGGLTSMELMAVAQGQIWIHSEIKHEQKKPHALHKGMPLWESGNATYLKEKKGARLITPGTFFQECRSFFFRDTPNSIKKGNFLDG